MPRFSTKKKPRSERLPALAPMPSVSANDNARRPAFRRRIADWLAVAVVASGIAATLAWIAFLGWLELRWLGLSG